MEPERKIEQWLRALSKRRRDQAGPDFELHPATRRLLQDEVRRQFRAPGRPPASFLRNFLRFSFRPVEVLVVLACVALFAALLLPSLSRAKRKAMSVSAASNLKQIGVAAFLYAGDNQDRLPVSYGEMAKYLGEESVTRDPVSGEQFVYVGGGRRLKTLPPDSVLAYSPADQKNRAVLFADGHVELADRNRFAELTRGLMQLARADKSARRQPEAVPPPAAPAPVAVAPPAVASRPPTAAPAELERSPEPAALMESLSAEAKTTPAGASDRQNHQLGASHASGQPSDSFVAANTWAVGAARQQANSLKWPADIPRHFARTDLPAQEEDHFKKGNAGKAVSVLASFQLVQNGTELRVVDADGSVYTGHLLKDKAATQTRTVTLDEESVTLEQQRLLTPPPAGSLPRDKDVAKEKLAEAPVPPRFFRVAGTNLTLHQSVVFTGSWLARNTALADTRLTVTNGTITGESDAAAGGRSRGGGKDNESADTLAFQVRPEPVLPERISGTVIIGGTNQIEINARAVVP